MISEVTYWDLDTNALNSEITGSDDDVSGEAVRTLNPSWRESKSEASVLVFPNGTIWDADTECVLDAIRFVALDSGLIEDPTTPVKGALFTEAYRRCRDHYDAPLPRWEPAVDGERTVTPHLPDASELVDTRDVNGIDTDRLTTLANVSRVSFRTPRQSAETTLTRTRPHRSLPHSRRLARPQRP